METTELTPEKVMDMGKELEDFVLAGLTAEELLARFEPDEILSRLDPDEVLSRFHPDERLKGLKAEEIEAYLRKIKQENN